MYPDSDLIVYSLYVISRAERQGGTCNKLISMPFEIFSVFVRLWWVFLCFFQKHVILQITHIDINSTCEGFHVTEECMRAVFLFPYPA